MAVPLRRCSSQNCSGYTPALTATARRTGVGGSDTVGNLKGLNFGLSQPVSARRAHLPTSITVPPRPLAPWEEAFLCPQTVMHQATHTQQSMRIHNRTLKCGFPIAPAHTKWDVSSDYQHCSLLASGASILDLFFFFFSFCPLYVGAQTHSELSNFNFKIEHTEKGPSPLYSLKASKAK